MTSVRLAILGIGHWHAERQVQGFRAAGCRIVVVQDADAAEAGRWADRIGCAAAHSVEEALDRHRPELVLVMSPSLDAPLVIDQVLDRRLAYAAEKPGAVNARALTGVVRRTRQLEVLSSVAFVNRLSGFWPLVERHRTAGDLGSGLTARFRIINGSAQRYVDDGVDWVVNSRTFGGGSLRNVGAHAVDAAELLLGPDPRVLGAACNRLGGVGDVEDQAVALLADGTGNTAVVESGYLFPQRDGTDHVWEVLAPGLRIIETERTLSVVTPRGEKSVSTPDMAERYDAFARLTVQSLRTQEPSGIGIETAHRVLQLTDRIYQHCAGNAGSDESPQYGSGTGDGRISVDAPDPNNSPTLATLDGGPA